MHQRFVGPGTWRALRTGPLREYVDGFVEALDSVGYRPTSIGHKLQIVVQLGKWLKEAGLEAGNLDEARARGFLRWWRRTHRWHREAETTIPRLRRYLRSIRVLPPAPACAVVRKRGAALLERYATYLRKERGLTEASVVNNVPVVDRFLLERFAAAPLRIDRLNAKDVRGFVLRRARAMSPGRTKGLVTAMRSFLRYLFMRGEITRDLASGVPAVSMRQRDQVPRFISADGVRRVLGACDRRSSTGRRDYAVLLLLARLGLRASDVVRMTLDDLDWDAGELSVCGKGVRRDRFPIPVDVGGALTEYLRRDRPRCGSRRVFITSTAPLHGFSGPSTVSTIVKSAIVRSGVSAPTKGAHLLRHSLATDLIRRGASLEEIGDLLRHRSPNTTLLYAKVDLASLRDVARPWPGGAA